MRSLGDRETLADVDDPAEIETLADELSPLMCGMHHMLDYFTKDAGVRLSFWGALIEMELDELPPEEHALAVGVIARRLRKLRPKRRA